jgi:type IV pilus assembly protein PilC
MLLHADIPVGESVLLIQDDEPDKAGKAVMQSLFETLRNGLPLSAALRESGVFPAHMSNMAEIGENTGRLVETLKALSEYYDRQDRLAATIKNAVMYPSILLAMMIAVILILIIRILPIFNDVFGRLGTQMSHIATRLMLFGGWFTDAAGVIAISAGLIFLTAFILWIIPNLRRKVTQIFRDKWGGRGIFNKIVLSRFIYAMSLAMSSGLDTADALNMAVAVSGGGKPIIKKYQRCTELIRSGSTLHGAMHESGLLTTRDARMLSLGSRSGMADLAMAEIARRSDRIVQDSVDRIVARIEPVLVMITSVIVGIILLSVMLPLIGIMTAIG